ncbi:hypothetical protein pEaSNUABM56_00224 [Erwinia phage pEa_SNUABM_56]|nr:hypothetical protein pEaSNUABM55_00152 [Erwinia phage pEa_SNUABM_55]UYL85244.1 hypothetical protein pEaSNUABM56_00224 [Erwinia phage pEa_SNUABM_56]
MTVGIHGILSHRKLMELKNCGAVAPEFFEEKADQLFNLYRLTVAGSLASQNTGFLISLFYGEKEAERDARWMFPDRRDMLEHLIYLEGNSKYITLTKEELDEFTLLHQAAIASDLAQKTLKCFKYSDQVIVDEDTGFNIDWLLKNAYLLKQRIAAHSEE